MRIELVYLALFVSSSIGPSAFAGEALDRLKLERIDAEIEQAIAEQKMPGAVLWLEHGAARYHKAYGDRAVAPTAEAMSTDSIFDLASLTKVVATTDRKSVV